MPPDPTAPLGPDPDAIEGQTFGRSRKGFDPAEVQAYLVDLASQLRESQRNQAAMALRLSELERRSVDPRELGVIEVTELLGEETAQVLDTARQAAIQIQAKADQYVTETRQTAAAYDTSTRSEADEYAHATRHAAADDAEVTRSAAAQESVRVRAQAEGVLAERTAEAEAAAAVTRAEADAYAAATQTAADAYRADATADGEQARAAVESEVVEVRAVAEDAAAEGRVALQAEAERVLEVARSQGRSMVDEARDYRERVIADLAERRRAAWAALQQLAANRDALAVTLTDVADRIHASHHALSSAEITTRGVGDVAGDRAALPDRHFAEALRTPPPGQRAWGETEPHHEPIPEVDDSPVEPAADEVAAVVGTEIVAVQLDREPAPDPVEVELDPEPATGIPEPVVPEPIVPELVVVEPEPVAPDPEPTGDSDLTGGSDRAAALFAQLKAATKAGTAATEQGAGRDKTPSAPVAAFPVGDTEGQPHGGDPDVDLLDRRDATTDELERRLARRLKRVLSDEQNEALDRMRRVKGAPQVDQVLVSEDDHRERYRAAAAEDLTASERAGAGFFGEAPDKPAPIGDIAEAFASDLVQALRGRLEAAFHDGGDEHEISERIRACYREWKTQRIADVARHYVQVAFGRGVAAFELDSPTRWLVDHAGVPAPDCDDNALAGAVAPGEPFPTGDIHPPIHPGCRCLAVPFIT